MACHTIHVDDIVEATWEATQWYRKKGRSGTVIFNLADKGKTTHGDIVRAVGKVFDVPVQFYGSIKLKMYHVALKMEMVRDEVNEKHMKPWTKLLEDSGIHNSQLSPYMDETYLQFEEVNVDGGKLTRETGYQYKWSGVTVEGLKAQVASYQRAGIWPKETKMEGGKA
ncbi:hypothetical protein BJ684DRAFT_17572 [Piptocephalis cylindrospora]|uniref:NmrA-like domain-containing protein n=1 Tax=Piptocephalis cylindrospora TaxID=1907219 RepID=A0A4P9XZN8_9FUNG|nr:hypothetical protein BJ684DRAFT_17572 [Piptocephalis cylindrospora]|eukprot:RKP11887.1 hypothetical protein BJ684DRAFT_17572 [Piptocephalis cylindrospora]